MPGASRFRPRRRKSFPLNDLGYFRFLWCSSAPPTDQRRWRRVRRALLVVAALVGVRAPATSASPLSEWSLLLYVDADCNLEGPILEQLQALIDVGGNSDVRVVALVDRHRDGVAGAPGAHSAEPIGGLADWTGAKRLEIVPGRLVDHDPGPVPEVDMASPATLGGFLRWARRLAPARRTALLLKDHGLGFLGLITDDAPTGAQGEAPSWMSLEELQRGLEAGLGGDRLDLLVADACSMACVEFLSVAAPFASKAVAAESLTRVGSLRPGAVLRALKADPSMDGTALGRELLEQYGARRAEPAGAHDADVDRRSGLLGLFDLDAWGDARRALGDLGSALVGSVGARGERGDRWVARRRLATPPIITYSCESDRYNCATYDLDELLTNLRVDATPQLSVVLNRLERRLRRATLAVVRGPDFAGRGGLQVYLPRDGLLNDATGLPPSHWCDGWGAFVRAHARRRGVVDSAVEVATPTVETECGEPVVRSRIVSDPEQVGIVSLVLRSTTDDTEMFRIPTHPDECGRLRTPVRVQGLQLRIGPRSPRPLPVASVRAVPGRDDGYVVDVPVLWASSGDPVSGGMLTVLLDASAGTWRTELLSVADRRGGLAIEVELDRLTSLAPLPAQLASVELQPVLKADEAASLRSADGRRLVAAIDVVTPAAPFVADVEAFYEVVDVDGAVVKSAAVRVR